MKFWSKRSTAYNTVYAVRRLFKPPHPNLLFASLQVNFAYTETLAKIVSLLWLMSCDYIAVILVAKRHRLTATIQNLLAKPSVFW